MNYYLTQAGREFLDEGESTGGDSRKTGQRMGRFALLASNRAAAEIRKAGELGPIHRDELPQHDAREDKLKRIRDRITARSEEAGESEQEAKKKRSELRQGYRSAGGPDDAWKRKPPF